MIESGAGQDLTILLQFFVGKFVVCRFVDAPKIHDLRALEKWAVGRNKHIFKHMALASREHEPHIVQVLNVGAKQCLHLLVGIAVHHLKLIERHIALLPRIFHIGENFRERFFGVHWLHIKHNVGLATDSVETEHRA